MNDSIFPDDTDSNHDDDGYSYNDDNERNMSETISTSQHEGEDIDVWLKFFEEKNKIVDWDPENLDQEKLLTQDTNYGSEIAFRVEHSTYPIVERPVK